MSVGRYVAKGTAIELAGTEKVEDRIPTRSNCMKDGHSIHLWIDAQTFWKQIEGRLGGSMASSIPWRSTTGLPAGEWPQIPFVHGDEGLATG